MAQLQQTCFICTAGIYHVLGRNARAHPPLVGVCYFTFLKAPLLKIIWPPKVFKNSTKNSRTLFIQIPQMLTYTASTLFPLFLSLLLSHWEKFIDVMALQPYILQCILKGNCFCNTAQWSKPGNGHWYTIVIYRAYSAVPTTSFEAKEDPDFLVRFSRHASFSLEKSLSLYVSFLTLTVSKNIEKLLCRMPLILNMMEFSLFKWYSHGRKSPEVML